MATSNDQYFNSTDPSITIWCNCGYIGHSTARWQDGDRYHICPHCSAAEPLGEMNLRAIMYRPEAPKGSRKAPALRHAWELVDVLDVGYISYKARKRAIWKSYWALFDALYGNLDSKPSIVAANNKSPELKRVYYTCKVREKKLSSEIERSRERVKLSESYYIRSRTYKKRVSLISRKGYWVIHPYSTGFKDLLSNKWGMKSPEAREWVDKTRFLEVRENGDIEFYDPNLQLKAGKPVFDKRGNPWMWSSTERAYIRWNAPTNEEPTATKAVDPLKEEIVWVYDPDIKACVKRTLKPSEPDRPEGNVCWEHCYENSVFSMYDSDEWD